jgi:hypothetical protein
MTRSDERDGTEHRHAGQWVLLDARGYLLAIGESQYYGSSPKASLDLTARRTLLPVMISASQNGQAQTRIVENLGSRWAVSVQTVTGGQSGRVVAVLGCYERPHVVLSAPPLVGAWEWGATPPGAEQRVGFYWSPALLAVHGMAARLQGGAHWQSGPQWLDELVVASDRAETSEVLAELLGATDDKPRFHVLRVRSPETGQVHRVRLVGWRDVGAPGPDVWLRGVLMPVDDGSKAAQAPMGIASYLDAAFALARDPLCAIDIVYEHILLTTARFGELDVVLPEHRDLAAICHEDDLPALRAMLTAATANLDAPVGPVHVRFAKASGGWTMLELTGFGVRLSGEEPQHALCRATPVGEDAWPG